MYAYLVVVGTHLIKCVAVYCSVVIVRDDLQPEDWSLPTTLCSVISIVSSMSCKIGNGQDKHQGEEGGKKRGAVEKVGVKRREESPCKGSGKRLDWKIYAL